MFLCGILGIRIRRGLFKSELIMGANIDPELEKVEFILPLS
jgi:hypothetical protein